MPDFMKKWTFWRDFASFDQFVATRKMAKINGH